jgi:hypothetical protein
MASYNPLSGMTATPAPKTTTTSYNPLSGLQATSADIQAAKPAAKPAAAGAGTAGQVVDSKTTIDPAIQALQDQIAGLTKSLTASQQQNSASANQLYSLLANQQAQADKAKQLQQTNWITAGKDLLTQYGVGGLGDAYMNLITTKGLDQSTAMLELQSTPEWKQRFSANESRLKQGLSVLDPATYLATEAAYKDVLIAAGIPNSTVNDVNYLGQLIAKDVSPVEVQQRVDAARAAISNEDPFVKQQLQQEFGLTTGDMVLHILDPEKASTIIQQKVNAAKVGAEFQRQGADISMGTAEQYAAQGITQAQAQQAAINVAAQTAPTQALAQRYGAFAPAGGAGAAITAADLGTAGAAQAQMQLQRLKTQEISAFSGSSGVGKGSLLGAEEGVS